MTLLILEYAQKKGLQIYEVPAKAVYSVIGVGHNCANNATSCHGREHEVELQPAQTCATKPTAQPTKVLNFQAVVLRLGVDAPAPFFKNAPLLITRQILPYHVSQ